MTRHRQALFAAASSSVCAVIWLANCVLDMTMKLEAPGQMALHVLCTVIWTVIAVMWWIRWHGSRPSRGDMQA